MYSRLVAALCLFFLGLVSALPPPNVAAAAVPTSITTTSSFQTVNGTVTETCVLVYIPVGEQIEEIRNCTMTVGGTEASNVLVAESFAASPTAAAAFVMPGTSIQVLPVGLGIYGGITAIAVFVVAYVTWERIQSRKTFRQQRITETNSIGSGMSKGDFRK